MQRNNGLGVEHVPVMDTPASNEEEGAGIPYDDSVSYQSDVTSQEVSDLVGGWEINLAM